MKNTKRILTAMLALLTIAGTAASCGNDTTDPGKTTTKNPSTQTDTDDGIKDNLPELNFNNETIKILHFGYEMIGDTPDWNREGDNIADAVASRDLATEERLGVTIEYAKGSDDWYAYPAEVKKLTQSGDCPYDLIFMESSQCFKLALENCFLDISDLDYVDLEQPWWYKDFMDGSSISTDKRFLLTGAFSISTLEGASCTIFNKTLYNNYFESYHDLYDMVEAGTWTYDALIELCRDAYDNVNGNTEADEGDIFGMFNRGIKTANYMSMSTGLTYLDRDEDGLPVLNLYNEDSLRWVETLHEILSNNEIAYTNPDVDGIEHFVSGKAVFFPGTLAEFTSYEVRNMNDPHGVLPMPVLDEGMKYMSAAATVNGQSAVIPTTAPDNRLEIAGAVMESLCIEGYRSVLPAWYDVALKGKHADDERDADMIDIIYDTIDTSFIMAADKLLGTGTFFFDMLVNDKKTPGEFASYYETKSSNLNKKWKDMLDNYANLE